MSLVTRRSLRARFADRFMFALLLMLAGLLATCKESSQFDEVGGGAAGTCVCMATTGRGGMSVRHVCG